MAFGGANANFDNLKIGYDSNNDDDLDDAGDDLAYDATFGGTSKSVSHDHAGNLIDDGSFRYVYDAWNRLIKVQKSADSGAVVVQTAEFDATGRRMRKTVTNSGIHNGVVVYLYDGHKVLETRNGSNQVVQQFVHGTQYVDEVVMTRVKDKGDLYVHQDANWNVLATTDPAGRTAERWVYRPYGEFVIHQASGFGDRDGDGDVDATDKGSVGTTCTGTVSGSCRVLDLDFDGDYDANDATKFDSLPQGLRRSPGRTHSALAQPFAHQGLLFEPEIASYQNRARQYDPNKRRFMQRDPLGTQHTIVIWAGVLRIGAYERLESRPLGLTDSTGLQPESSRLEFCCGGPECNPIPGTNWCGPHYSGGLCEGCAGPPAPPNGPTDSCCEQHDACYVHDGDNTACNAQMCTCLNAIPEGDRGSEWWPVKLYFCGWWRSHVLPI